MFDGKTPYEVSEFRQVQIPMPAIAVLLAVPGGIVAYGLNEVSHFYSLEDEENLEIEGDMVTLHTDEGMTVFVPLKKDSELLDLLPYEFEELHGECFR